MKKIFFILMFLSFAEVTFAQTVESSSEDIYNAVEVKPDFVGGMKEFYKFIGQEFKVPKVKNLKGRILIQFVVEIDGSLSDFKVIKDIGYGTGEEAIRVLSKSPKWNPGKMNGEPVRVLYTLPIAVTSR